MRLSIYEIWKSGALSEYIELGIVKGSVIEQLRLVKVYMKERESGCGYNEAVRVTCEKAGASESSVKRAVARLI